MLTRLSSATVVALVCAVALVAAQAPTPTEQTATPAPEVTFRTEVNYVEEDVRVVDRNGNFVRGLKEEDFQITEDGKPQKIQTFGLVDIPVTPLRKPQFLGPNALPIEPDVASNKQVLDGRLYLIVLDDYHIAPLRTQNAKNLARRFVLEKLGPDDQAAVVVTSGLTTASQDFTQNRRLLIEAIDHMIGQKLQSAAVQRNERRSRDVDADGNILVDGEPAQITPENMYTEDIEAPQRMFNARSSLNSLRSISEWMSAIQGRRKAIVLISEGVDYNLYDVFTGADPSNFNFENYNMIQQETLDTIQAASRSNVQIYPVDPRGLTTQGQENIEMSGLAPGILNLGTEQLFQELSTSQMNLRQLAEETGGVAAVSRNDFDAAFDRIVQENSSYYVLGYYSTNDKRDGRFRSINVKIAGHPDAQVTYRKRYAAARGNRTLKNTAAGKPLDSAAGITAELVQTMASPLPKTGLQLRVTAITRKGTNKTNTVDVLIDSVGKDLQFQEKGGTFNDTLSLSIGVFNKQGKSVFAERPDVDLNLRPETHARVQQSGVRIIRRLTLPPGRYQLRVAAQDNAKTKQGSAHLDLEVPDFSKGPIGMSSIAIASSADRAVPTGSDLTLGGGLPGAPSAIREFPLNSELAVFVEVYDNQPTPPHRLDITSTVRTADGRVVFTHNDERASEDLKGTPGAFPYSTRIPIKDWAPGLYVLTLEAKSRLGKTEPVTRMVQFEVN